MRSESEVAQSCPTLSDPMDCSMPFPSPGDLPNPGIKPGSSALQADSLPSEPPGKLVWIMLHFMCQYMGGLP